MSEKAHRIQILVDVQYEPTDTSVSALKRVLERGIAHAIGSGLLSADLDVEVDTHEVHVNEATPLTNWQYLQSLVKHTYSMQPPLMVVVMVEALSGAALTAVPHPNAAAGIRVLEPGGSRDPVGQEGQYFRACVDQGRFNLHIQGPGPVRSWSDNFLRREPPTPEYLGLRLVEFERTFLRDAQRYAMAARQGQGRDQPRVSA